jgi:hypothetical protein
MIAIWGAADRWRPGEYGRQNISDLSQAILESIWLIGFEVTA